MLCRWFPFSSRVGRKNDTTAASLQKNMQSETVGVVAVTATINNMSRSCPHDAPISAATKTYKHKLSGCATSVACPCIKFMGFLLVAGSMHTLLRGLMKKCATRSRRCTLASTIVRRTSGNTLEGATNTCGCRPRPASGARGPLAKAKRKCHPIVELLDVVQWEDVQKFLPEECRMVDR